MTPFTGTPRDHRLASSLTRKAAVLAGAVSPVLAARSLLPDLLTQLLNHFLEKLPGIQVTLDDVEIHPLRGRATFRRVLVTSEPEGPLRWNGQAAAVTITWDWKELVAGRFMGELLIDRPVLHAAKHVWNKPVERPIPKRRATDLTWQRQAKGAIPFCLKRLVIQGAELHISNLPAQGGLDVRSEDLQIVAENLTNSNEFTGTMRATMAIEGRVMGAGQFEAQGELYPFADQPTFNADLQLQQLNLVELQPVIRQWLGAYVKSGTLELYAEAAAAKGRIKGYVKPIIDAMEVEKERGVGFFDALKTVTIKGLNRLLRNPKQRRVATRIDFGGPLADPSIGYVAALGNFLKNAFGKALTPRLDFSIGFSKRGRSAYQTDIDLPAKKPSKFQRFMALVKTTGSRWSADQATRMSAALSYYTIFSIAPLLLLAIAVVGLVFGEDAAQGEVFRQLSGYVGPRSAEAIQGMIKAAQKPAAGTVATIVGILSLFFGASGVLQELKSALNRIWKVPGRSGIKALLRERILSFAMILSVGFLLLVSMVLSAVIAAAGKFVGGMLPIPEALLQLANAVVSFLIITVLFALIYKVLPDAKIRWSDVWIGSVVTSVLFTIGKMLIGFYLGKASVASSYGAAGSLIVVLLWVYYSAMIVYFGAEFTKAQADDEGDDAPPVVD